ncbi:MAG: NYN domain-containing protein [Candidatus Omnitrophica bacterium]|nr:NYN domain-containing protein [Candidatus Omnitrophota bacterium]
MSLHYILDGYNILKQVSHLSDRKLKHGRLGLIQMLRLSPSLKKQKITIVFDGCEDGQGLSPRRDFQILFSKSLNADNKIKSLVERSDSRRRIVVVSDDKELCFFIRGLGACILSVSEFTSEILQKYKTSSDSRESEKDLDYKQKLAINREFRKIWLGETD